MKNGIELIHGETVNTLERLRQTGERFDALVTDPPYSSGGLHLGVKSQATNVKYVQTGSKRRHIDFGGDARSQLGWITWCSLWLNQCRSLLANHAPVLMFCDWRQIGAAIQAMESGGFVHRGVVVWNKKTARPNPNSFRPQCEFVVVGSHGKRRPKDASAVYLPGVFEFATPSGSSRRHQTQKPLALLENLLDIVPKGGRVLDPFAGSGSTLEAAYNKGLAATGIEEHPDIYADTFSHLSS